MMGRTLLVAVLLGAAFAGTEANAAKETPVQKVIQLLDDMIAKGTEEKQKEQVQLAAFKAFCDSTTADKQSSIKDAAEKIEGLNADIQKFEAEADTLGTEISALELDISTWEGDFKAASKVRDIESNDYTSTHKDYTESIDALQKGIDTLQKSNHNVGQSAAALLQLKGTSLISVEAKTAIDRWLGQDVMAQDENLAVAAPQANAFEANLQGMIDMLD